MFKLGIPKRHYRRATMVLGPESANHIEYESTLQDDGFYMFSFPEADEFAFRNIANSLNAAGVLTVGDDETLTERKIMKLTDLLKEEKSSSFLNQNTPSPGENGLIDILKRTIESWEKPSYRGGIEGCEKSNHYFDDLSDIIEDYEEDLSIDTPAPSDLSNLQEQKLRKLIIKTIRQ